MAKPLRLEFPGALYHITSRGNRREAIYDDNADRANFLELLVDIIERCNWRCHANCLMTNHYHLVVETPRGQSVKGDASAQRCVCTAVSTAVITVSAMSFKGAPA